MAKHAPAVPPWLVGLIVAVVVFALALWAFSALGFGDDPVVEGLGPVTPS